MNISVVSIKAVKFIVKDSVATELLIWDLVFYEYLTKLLFQIENHHTSTIFGSRFI